MKKLFASFFAGLVCYTISAQQANTVVINQVKQNQQELYRKMYQYPEFTDGSALGKDGYTARSKFNYSYLSNQLSFLGPKGDTLELTNGADFTKIIIATDTFYYYNKQFLLQVTHYPAYNLLLKHSLQLSGSEKKGAYGTYSGNSAISSVNQIVDNGVGTVKLAVDENFTYSFKDFYFISGKFGQIYPSSKKGFYELFSKNEKQLKEFLSKNEINYLKKEDIEKLLAFAREVIR